MAFGPMCVALCSGSGELSLSEIKESESRLTSANTNDVQQCRYITIALVVDIFP
jgi:hypothetical protein